MNETQTPSIHQISVTHTHTGRGPKDASEHRCSDVFMGYHRPLACVAVGFKGQLALNGVIPCQWLAMQLTDGALALCGCTIHRPYGAVDVAAALECSLSPCRSTSSGRAAATSNKAPCSKLITQSWRMRPLKSMIRGARVKVSFAPRPTSTCGSIFVSLSGTPLDTHPSCNGNDGVNRHARRSSPTSIPVRMKFDCHPCASSWIQLRSDAPQPMTRSSSAIEDDIASSSSCVERFA